MYFLLIQNQKHWISRTDPGVHSTGYYRLLSHR